jgi:hypothetical protein
MQVDYLLYHEDRSKVDRMLECITDVPEGLFEPWWWRKRMRVAHSWNEPTWSDVTFIHFERVGINVLRYNVTLPKTREYPALVAALLIDKGWLVKVRYRNDDTNSPWRYNMKCEFPEGTEYAHPVDWKE